MFPLVFLLMGRAAAAQSQPPVREQQQRQVVVPNNPDEPVPEVRVAAHVATYLRFDAPIDRASVEVEGRATRFRVVDPGERTLTLEPTVEPGPGEKLGVRVRYKDSTSPASATFALVSHSVLVDKEVEVVRRPRSVEALEAALAEKDAQLAALRVVNGPAGLAFSGRLTLSGVRARRIKELASARDGLTVTGGAGYRAEPWALVVVRVHNLPGQKPWEPGEARLALADGTPVTVVSMDMNRARLGAGEEGLVAVETEAPFWRVGALLRLELLDKSGSRRLPVALVEL